MCIHVWIGWAVTSLGQRKSYVMYANWTNQNKQMSFVGFSFLLCEACCSGFDPWLCHSKKKKKTKCQILWGKSDNKVVVTSFVMHNICDSNLTIFFSHHFFSIQTSKRKPMNLQTCKHPRIINAQHSKIPFLVKAFIRCKLLFLVS